MKKIIGFGLSLLIFSQSIIAKSFVSVGHLAISDEVDPIYFLGPTDINLNALALEYGYRYKLNETLSIVPEATFAYGLGSQKVDNIIIGGDMIFRGKVELSKMIMFSLSGEYRLGDSISVFATTSYAKSEYEVIPNRSSIISHLGRGWNAGIGGGIVYSFTKHLDSRISYDVMDQTKVFNVNLSYYF